MPFNLNIQRIAPKIGLASLALMLGACQLTTNPDPTAGLEFRAKRYAQFEQKQAFEICRDEAMERDEQARNKASSGAYLNSARVAEKCGTLIDQGSDVISTDEKMRLNALVVINYFKGGDTEKARRSFDVFKSRYPGHDLYFADGSSFIASTDALLGRTDDWTFGELADLNVNADLKREIRRMHHWKNR